MRWRWVKNTGSPGAAYADALARDAPNAWQIVEGGTSKNWIGA
jgi:hypothetical protein